MSLIATSMYKTEIIRSLKEVHESLMNSRNILKNVDNNTFWIESNMSERDDIVKIQRKLNNVINEIVNVFQETGVK